MDKQAAAKLITQTFEANFDEQHFTNFARNLFNQIDESKAFSQQGAYIWDAFKDHVRQYKRLGTYTDPAGTEIDILMVRLKKETALGHARTMQRNFVARYLKERDEKDAAIVAYYTDGQPDWRFSLVKMEYQIAYSETTGRLKTQETLTPARRYSFLVGENEPNHTAQQQLVPLLQDTRHNPTLAQLEDAFNIESVTVEFFQKYKEIFLNLREELDRLARKEKGVKAEFGRAGINTANFAKKLLGQIVFLYFLQKKGWLGVAQGDAWGSGPKDFLRRLFDQKDITYTNFFNDVLESLFYDALAIERPGNFFDRLNCRIPFLNGGLFEPMGNYNWQDVDILLNNACFHDIFETFDLFNFTVREDEPLEKEVAVDPEMLGKVFENLLDVTDRKSKGAFYTPREIVHYMCQESLINYLDTSLNSHPTALIPAKAKQQKLFGDPDPEQLSLTATETRPLIPRQDIDALIRKGELVLEHDAAKASGTKSYQYQLPQSIRSNAADIDAALASIKICDPAIGSGAFPVGLMQEIVKARTVLTTYLKPKEQESKNQESKARFGMPEQALDSKTHFPEIHYGRTPYHFKRHAIQESIYGVDIDPGAVDIAKLRLWLSLVVDEDSYDNIQPLPNLDYKIVCGNALLGVEKDLFNHHLFAEIEELKPIHFAATDPAEKRSLKSQIDNLIAQLTHGNIQFDFEIYFSEVFHHNGGFDVMIANPPYVGEKGNKETFRELKTGTLGKFYKRKVDLFYFFFHLALNLVKTNSHITFITTNYYLTASQAGNLRQDFKERANIKKLINFNELRIFESATGQHNMITILCKNQDANAKAKTCISRRNGDASPEVLHNIVNWMDPETNYYDVMQKDLYEGSENYIRLIGAGNYSSPLGNTIPSVLNKVKLQGITLGTLCNVNQGIISGADKVTSRHIRKGLITEEFKNHGIYVLSKLELLKLKLSEEERQIAKAFFKNSDIQKYYCSTRPDRFLFYVTRDIDISNYPTIRKHFEKYKQIVRNRSENRGEIQAALALGKWWVVFAARNVKLFLGAKIVSPQRSLSNTFAYNECEWFASADVYFITEKEKNISLKYILALLNSNLYYVWLYHKGKRKGKALELYHKPLTEIPVKKVSSIQQKPFIALVDQILTAKKANPAADVSALEDEIDQLVYQLYGLTDEEIDIVEGQ